LRPGSCARLSGCDSAPIVVTLPIATVSEANQREHWATKARRVKSHRQIARLMCPYLPPPLVVTLTRIAPRSLDDDNLCAAMKATRDGIADRLGVTDNDPRVVWRYAQQRGRIAATMIELAPNKPEGQS
jgi:crossover junction endodeoxyribonuclease RusA